MYYVYFCSMKANLQFFTILFFLFPFVGYSQISGWVTDEEGNPLPSAEVFLYPDSIGIATDNKGYFSFKGIHEGKYQLEVNFIGYTPYKVTGISVGSEEIPSLNIKLSQQLQLLEQVVVMEEHAKQENTLSAEHFAERFLEENIQGTFAKSIEKLPGISAINVGVGIAKPVIRGLSSNRIIVNQQGVKQESHQWGADHGLEIDQFDVERVEIIKGPASLQYGSDGLGGVINIMPARVIPTNTWKANLQGIYKTNNQHWGGSASLTANLEDVFVSARYSRQEFGDYRVPTDQFNYNSFILPIFNNTLKNTAGKEQNIRLSAGISRDWGVSRVVFSHYSLQAGLFSGAVGIPRSYALTEDGNNRDLDVPKQEVDHYRLTFHQTLVLGEDHLDLNIGYQRNLRQEFSFPEFHSIPSSQIDPGSTLALQFELQTISANLHYQRHHSEDWTTVWGGNVQRQENVRGGFEFLLPNFRTLRAGVFSLSEWQLNSQWLINAGLRLDYAENDTDFFRQWVWDSNENITDSLVAPVTTPTYFNWSASFGSSLTLQDGRWILKGNIGKSFRVPYPAETVSNGIHHGTFRHEVGTPGLKSEHGYQLDLSAEWNLPNFRGNFSTYFNYFDNYIYLGPTFPARFSPLPESGQIFQYRQDDALYTGFEFQWNWDLLPFLSLSQSADFVQSYNLNTRLALPFTPQPSVRTNLRYTLRRNGWLEEFFIELGYDYIFAAEGQLRVDRSERSTPSYQLWQAGAGLRMDFSGQEVLFNIQGQNLFDTFYLNHLSRYRLINVPEQGRNIVFSLKVPISGKIKVGERG
jgi:iron complex outermembrane receptor protein